MLYAACKTCKAWERFGSHVACQRLHFQSLYIPPATWLVVIVVISCLLWSIFANYVWWLVLDSAVHILSLTSYCPGTARFSSPELASGKLYYIHNRRETFFFHFQKRDISRSVGSDFKGAVCNILWYTVEHLILHILKEIDVQSFIEPNSYHYSNCDTRTI